MRFVVAILSSALLTVLLVAQTATMTPEALVQRGLASYRASHYANAATDLEAASQALLSQEQMQNYVNTGKFPNIERFETALVYLTLAQSKLGQKEKAREAVLRLQTAERIDSTYASLSLGSDAVEFESAASKLVPGFSMKASGEVAHATPPPQPAASTVADTAPTKPAVSTTTVATTTLATTTAPPAPPPVQVSQASMVPAPTPPQTSQTKPAPKAVKPPALPPTQIAQTSPPPPRPATTTPAPSLTSQLADCQSTVDELVAQERARIQKDADARIAAIQREADERVAQAQRAAETQMAAMQSTNRKNYLLSLRQADGMAAAGKTDQASDIYNMVVSSSDAPREVVAEAAVGLYRTGAYRSAVTAFRKLSPYKRGEEDLRYYNAVSLYETGDYDEAKRELACALPYIQVTADVTRYRQKIENTGLRRAAR